MSASATDKLRGASTLMPLDSPNFLALKIPERRLMMGPWLPEKGLAMVHAPRGMGKTRFSMSAAYAVASGVDWLGFKVPDPRKVLYVDGEMPASEMQTLFREIKGGLAKEVAPEHFRFLCSDLHEYGIPDLATEDGQARLNAALGDAELLILDNLSCLFRSGKENEAESWGETQSWLLEKRREGRTVLLVHHTGKSGAQRGTSKREDVLDTVIGLKHPEDYKPDEGARFEVHFEKSRGFSGPDVTPFQARMETVGGKAVWHRSAVQSLKADVLGFMRAGGSTREAQSKFGVPKSTVQRWKDEAPADASNSGSPAVAEMAAVPASQH